MISGIELLNEKIRLRAGRVKHALFDFDGTISVLRQGWEDVMIPMMIEMICGGAAQLSGIEKEVMDYVDLSTGVLTIRQMEWLAEAVRRHGFSDELRSACEYKQIYVRRLRDRVEWRFEAVVKGRIPPDEMMIEGAKDFLDELRVRGVKIYLASGTDHEHVAREAEALGIAGYFDGGIFGALDHTEANDKERIIQRILDENDLSGEELLVAGDGPVEMRHAKAKGATAMGVASDEVRRGGLNLRKRDRLVAAGADLIIADYTAREELAEYLFSPVT